MVLVLSVLVTIAWMWNPGHTPRFDLSDTGYQSFREEVYGDAPKGVCYRVFVPYLCRAANAVAPGWSVRMMEKAVQSPPLMEMEWDEPTYVNSMLPAYAMAGAIALVSFLILGFTCGPWALLLAWAAIGPHGGVGDPVTLAAFGLAVWSLLRRKTWTFWLAFAVASLNRETAPLMLLWWLMAGRSIRAFGAGAACWIVLRGILANVYADNSMQMCWSLLEHNLKMIQPLSATTLFASIPVALLLLTGLQKQPNWMRTGYWVGTVLIAGMAILWSRPERMRTYLELLPMAAMSLEAGVWWFLLKMEVAECSYTETK